MPAGPDASVSDAGAAAAAFAAALTGAFAGAFSTAGSGAGAARRVSLLRRRRLGYFRAFLEHDRQIAPRLAGPLDVIRDLSRQIHDDASHER